MASTATIGKSKMNAVLTVAFLIWLVIMIAVPIVSGLGKTSLELRTRFRSKAISGGVWAQAAVVGIALVEAWPLSAVLFAVIVVPVAGWFAEFIGSRTGIPFGRYHYTEALQPQLLRVPLVIPFAWLMMLPPSWAVVQLVFPDASALVQAVLSGLAFMAWDIYLDPHLVKWGFWTWNDRGRYEGIPIRNFFGWFLWAAAITAVVMPLELPFFPLSLMYILTWLFQFGGHLLFWKWPVSGWAGFVAMGSFSIPALMRLSGIF